MSIMTIGGNPFAMLQSSPSGGAASVSKPTVIPQTMDLYKDALQKEQANYQNVLDSYSSGQSRLAAALPQIYQGYGDIESAVKNTLGFGGTPWGVAAPAATAIGQQFAQTQGQTQQDLINRGLGNTSVLGNLSNQNTLFAGQAYAGLGAQLAQTYAGYEAQLGLARQQAQMQGLGMQNQLSQAQGSTLAGYHFQFPSPIVGQDSTSLSMGPQRGGGGGGFGGQRGGPIAGGRDIYSGDQGAWNPNTYGGGDMGGYSPFRAPGGTGTYGSVNLDQATANYRADLGSGVSSAPMDPTQGGADLGNLAEAPG